MGFHNFKGQMRSSLLWDVGPRLCPALLHSELHAGFVQVAGVRVVGGAKCGAKCVGNRGEVRGRARRSAVPGFEMDRVRDYRD